MKLKFKAIRPVIAIIAGGLVAALIISLIKDMGGEVVNPLIVGLIGISTKLIESEEVSERDRQNKESD